MRSGLSKVPMVEYNALCELCAGMQGMGFGFAHARAMNPISPPAA